MKTTLLLTAALFVGTAAIAQDAPTQGSPPMTNTPAPATPDASAPPPADASAPAPAPQMPPEATPPADASAPAAPPAGDATAQPAPGGMSGGASGGNMGAAQQAAGSTDTSNYPTCSRTVTDKCVQRGGSGKAMAHHRMRKHK